MKTEDITEKGSAASEPVLLLEEAKQFELITAVIVGIQKDGSFYLSASHPDKRVLEYLLENARQGVDILVAKTH